MESALVERLEKAVAQLEQLAARGFSAKGGSQSEGSINPLVEQFKTQIDPLLQDFITKSEFNDFLKRVGVQVKNAYQLQFILLSNAFKCRQPQGEELQKLAQIMNGYFQAANELKALKAKAPKDIIDHLNAVCEGIQSFGWVFNTMPMGFIQAMLESGDFYAQKVLRLKKDNDTQWVVSFKKLLQELLEYVKENYKTGLEWKGDGNILQIVQSSLGGSGASQPAKQEETKQAAPAEAPKQEQKKEALKKWETPTRCCFAYFEGNKTLELAEEECKLNYFVVIHHCKDSNLQIKGKIKNVCVQYCTNVNVLVNSIVGQVEITNCNKVNIQALGTLPAVQVDNSDVIKLYLSHESKDNCEIRTSKSGEVVLNWPKTEPGAEEEEWGQAAVPLMVVSRIKNNKISAEIEKTFL